MTFTATVTSGGNPVTAGTVTFNEGATTLGAASPSTLRPGDLHHLALAVGNHPITAAYSGRPPFQRAPAQLNHTVRGGDDDGARLVAQPVDVGQPVTFTATVTHVVGNR